MSVKIYVEGGGDSDRTRTGCRRGFSGLVGKALNDLPKPRIVVCGGRGQTFKDFSRAAGEDEETALLLVDSEGLSVQE